MLQYYDQRHDKISGAVVSCIVHWLVHKTLNTVYIPLEFFLSVKTDLVWFVCVSSNPHTVDMYADIW